MALLAFDFGLSHIGVAVTEPRAGTASALRDVDARQGVPSWPVLDRLVRMWRPEGFVVGLPLNMDDTESEMSAAARRFGVRLRKRYAIAVQFADERLSTFEAAARGGGHAVAAQVIAETWLASGARDDGPGPRVGVVERRGS